MKTPDEIKKALECCFNVTEKCGECPYYPVSCDKELVRDARVYIRQLEAERDAMAEDLKAYCSCDGCKHSVSPLAEPCIHCDAENNCFEWRGVRKEE